MRSLTRYALANTVTRAMLSEILSRQDLEAIARAPSVEEAWNTLRKTAYGEWTPPYSGQDALEIERLLHQATGLRFSRSVRILTRKAREVGDLLLSRWDLDALEYLLRLWHGKERLPDNAFAYPAFVHALPAEKILQAENLSEIAALLRHTPYATPIISSAGRYEEKGSIFHVEVALERDHHRRLLDAVKALGGREKLYAAAFVGAEIDLVNLTVFARLFHYYPAHSASFSDVLIPGTTALSRHLVNPDVTVEAFDDLCESFCASRTGAETRNLTPLERAALLEALVSEMMVSLARRSLAGYPFSIVGIQAFYVLKRVELKNLRGVFAAKTCGLDDTAVSARIHGAR